MARRAGVSRPAVWRWQHRFAEQGIAGLLRDKPRVPGKPPLPSETVQRVLALTCSEPPSEGTHWTARTMAAAVGMGFSSARRIWQVHGLQPHRIRTFRPAGDAKRLPRHPLSEGMRSIKTPAVMRWLTRHPRWVFHFTPTSAIETFFSALTRRRLRRGVFRSIADLQAAINRYLAGHNNDPRPFVWTKSAEPILAKTQRLPEPFQ